MKSVFLFLLMPLLSTSSLLALATSPTARITHYDLWHYNGYQIQIQRVSDPKNQHEVTKFYNVLQETKTQIDQINQVGLPTQLQDYMKKYRIIVETDPWSDPFFKKGIIPSFALDYDYMNHVYISDYYCFNLLNEALQDYLIHELPQGINNPDVLKYYHQAKDLGLYRGSDTYTDWVMIDVLTFFSASAQTYLVGYSDQEPFSYDELKKNQPEFYSYLQTLFGPTAGFENQCFSYHGYLINKTALLIGWSFDCDPTKLQQELQRQVDYIEAAGLPATITNFFKTIPVTVAPRTNMGSNDSEGIYDGTTKSIFLNDDLWENQFGDCLQNPTLLHELLHAFHDQQLPQGWNNPDILKYYQQAKDLGCYKGTATGYTEALIEYGISNVAEFFAVTGTAYLMGANTYLGPFTRDEIQHCQPEYFQYLQKLFGPGAGTYLPYLAPSPLPWYKQLYNLWGSDMNAAY